MTGSVQAGGGFGGSVRAGMSESLQRRLAAEDAREAQEAARDARDRELQREDHHRRAVASAIAMATEDGEVVDIRRALRGEGLGHTPAEFIALASARQDVEDMRAAAREQSAFRRWQLEQSADASADTSAPHALDVAEGEALAARSAERRRKHREGSQLIKAARNLAGHDRRTS